MITLLPVPTVNVPETRVLWEPFLRKISKRTKIQFEDLMSDAVTGRVQLHLAWDDEQNKARALAGTQLEKNGADELICHLVWCTGDAMTEWVNLVDDIALWAKSHIGCVGIKATARPGWVRFLQPKGYRVTHVVMERAL